MPMVTAFFEFDTPSTNQVMVGILAGSVSVLWYEVVKWGRQMKSFPQTV